MKKILGYDVRDITIGRLLADKAAAHGDKLYLSFMADGRNFTYRDADAFSNRIANGLLGQGIGHGSHVAVLMDNSPEQLFTYYALGKIGAVVVPINTASRGQLLRYYIDQSDSTALVIDHTLLERFAEVASDLPKLEQVIVRGDRAAARDLATKQRRIVDFTSLEAAADTPPPIEVRYSDNAFIWYTSGTTGPSKGVMCSQLRQLYGAMATYNVQGLRDTDVVYACLPLYHAAATGAAMGTLAVDASIYVAERFSASRFWEDVRTSRATFTNLLGSMINIVWGQPPTAQDADNKLRMCSGFPIPKFWREFEKRFDMRFVSGYSLTDVGIVTLYTLTDPLSKLGSAGRPHSGTEVRIVDDGDFPVPAGTAGEITVRMAIPWAASSGYYKMPEQTVAATQNGWFHTGDLGYLDEDGYLWFVDRKKDSIRRRGENISAYEVEQFIGAHPSVAEVAVFAVRSEMAEDEVATCVVLNPGATLSAQELVDFCEKQMAHFMIPRFIRIATELPKGPTQKAVKYRLKEEAEKDRASYWDRERSGRPLKRG